MVKFAQDVLVSFKCLLDTPDEIIQRFLKHDVSQPLRVMIRRISDFMICLLHIFCAEMPAGYDKSTDKNVLKFSMYKGPLVFENAVRTALLDNGSWLAQEVADMVRTGATSRMCEDKLETLQKLLREPWQLPSAKTIRQCSELHKHVKESMRSAVTAEVTGAFREKIMEAISQLCIARDVRTITFEQIYPLVTLAVPLC